MHSSAGETTPGDAQECDQSNVASASASSTGYSIASSPASLANCCCAGVAESKGGKPARRNVKSLFVKARCRFGVWSSSPQSPRSCSVARASIRSGAAGGRICSRSRTPNLSAIVPSLSTKPSAGRPSARGAAERLRDRWRAPRTRARGPVQSSERTSRGMGRGFASRAG